MAEQTEAKIAVEETKKEVGGSSGFVISMKAAKMGLRLLPTALGTILTHYTTGPPQASWPLSTDLFTAIARKHDTIKAKTKPDIDVVKHMQAARKVIAFEKWIPPPHNGFACEVMVPVKKRGLGDVLKDWDEKEDGRRTVPADWVYHNAVYAASEPNPNVVLYFHGGAYCLMSKESHTPITISFSKAMNCRVFSVSYRLSPETPFPGALHDAVASYQYLTEDLKIPPGNIYFAGDSAGGGLSMGLLLYLRDQGMPLPGGAVVMSPWVDSTSSLMSWESNGHLDYLVAGNPLDPLDPIRMYVGNTNYDKYRLNPYVCPVVAPSSSFAGLPPILIQCGSAELLRDEGTLLAKRLSLAGVDVTHELMDGGIHVSQAFLGTEVSGAGLRGIKEWAAKQSKGEAWDESDVSKLVDEGRLKWIETKWKGKIPDSKRADKDDREIKVPKFEFVRTVREAPELLPRGVAHEKLKQVLEETKTALEEKKGEKEISAIWLASPAKSEGVWGKVRGALHL
ncbi:hypothetical protein T439DRAFT_141788 [Meredithblackwellia eburnea MCA 4105]